MFFRPEHVHLMPMCADPLFFSAPSGFRDQPLDIMWCGNERWLTKNNDQVEYRWEHHLASGLEVVSDAEVPGRFHFEYGDYQQRSRLLWYMLKDDDVPLQVVRSSYGKGYAKMMQSAKIVWHCQCGWNAYHMSEAYRIWQATASGTCLFTNETDSIGRWFELEKEVATYRLYYHQKHDMFRWFDYQEMKNRLLDLLYDEKRRTQIGEAAYERTLAEHMPEHRWATIFEKMGVQL